MQELKDKIRSDGKYLGDGILKIDAILNHQMDPNLIKKMGEEIANRFRDEKPTRILTAEVSGIAPALMATLALFFSFLLTGISFLRERSQGTMERLMASPVSRLDVVLGYLFGFFIFALIQSLIILLFNFNIYVLDVSYYGELWHVLVFQIAIVTGAVNLGILISTFSRNEFQVIQFIPLIITPQIFLCGVIWPVEQMPDYMQ